MERLGAALRGAATYGSVEDLIEDTLRNGPALAFVEFCLACRQRRQSRKDLSDVCYAWPERNKCQWLLRILPSIWAAYRALVLLANPVLGKRTLPTGSAVSVTKKARKMCAGAGLVAPRAAPVADQVAAATQTWRRVVAGRDFVVWTDQFCRSRYSKNPGTERNLSLQTTAVAAMDIMNVPTDWGGGFNWMIPLSEWCIGRFKDELGDKGETPSMEVAARKAKGGQRAEGRGAGPGTAVGHGTLCTVL